MAILFRLPPFARINRRQINSFFA